MAKLEGIILRNKLPYAYDYLVSISLIKKYVNTVLSEWLIKVSDNLQSGNGRTSRPEQNTFVEAFEVEIYGFTDMVKEFQ